MRTLGGNVLAKFDLDGPATTHGQLVFFLHWLASTRLFDHLCETAPLRYTSPNAPGVRRVLATLLCGILLGQRRYSHLGSFREDRVLMEAFGIRRFCSEDSVRRALKLIDWEDGGRDWLYGALRLSWQNLVGTDWLLDIDVQVKPLYGHQEGAKVSYNPHKPGRPSHAYHTFWMGTTRTSFGVDVQPGNQHSYRHGLRHLFDLVDSIPPDGRPKLVRGDCGYGNEDLMRELEERGQRYLFKLKSTRKVVELRRLTDRANGWQPIGPGLDHHVQMLQLSGWTRARKVQVFRFETNKPRKEPPPDAGSPKRLQLEFDVLLEDDPSGPRWEYMVVVGETGMNPLADFQLYRDRAGSENPHDELANQWGWGGFTTQDLSRCRICANLIALAYNWWSQYVRMVNPEIPHREVITSRPKLLHGVGILRKPGNKPTVTITPTHARRDSLSMSVLTFARFVNRLTAEQLEPPVIYRRCLTHAYSWFLASRTHNPMLGCLKSGPRPGIHPKPDL